MAGGGADVCVVRSGGYWWIDELIIEIAPRQKMTKPHCEALCEAVVTLYETGDLDDERLKWLIDADGDVAEALFAHAQRRRQQWYGRDVYKRGLIEFTNYCRNDCYYCGIRASNRCVERYRLTHDEILTCCRVGYELGFRTFVLQGGEDLSFKDDELCALIRDIKAMHGDCAITLSIGERSHASYEALFAAGADRYLLRHETANAEHYARLHPSSLSLAHRKACLFDLKSIGFQVGSGFMVGSPGQTVDYLVEDLRFLQALGPAMIGIGPFIPHRETPFCDEPAGSLKRTLNLVAILRLMFPKALIPSTTALGTIDPNGRELGLKAGANVVMPNLSPVEYRKKYTLYDGKICMGEEAAQCVGCLRRRVEKAGFDLVVARGDTQVDGYEARR